MIGPVRPARKVSLIALHLMSTTTYGPETACHAPCMLVHKAVDKHESGVSLPNTNHNHGLYRAI